MKALVKKFADTGLWFEEVPIPKVGDNEVLIKVRKSAICGTDVHIYKWDAWAQKTIPVPMVVGHEFMGEIVELGRNVHHLKVGARVVGEGHIFCGNCINCKKGEKHFCLNRKGVGVRRHGSFAEYFNLPAENVIVLPDSISDDLGAIFDPYGNAVHTTLAFDVIGEDVLITGAGPIGIMSVAIAKKVGARNIIITDMNEYRLDLAKKMGATHAVNVAKTSLDDVMKSIGISGFNIGLEMAGHPKALSTLLEKVQHGGKIALLGILPPDATIDWDLVIFKLLTLQGIYGRGVFSNWYKMIHLLEAGLDLEPVITHHFPIEEFEKGFEVMISGQSGKVILDW